MKAYLTFIRRKQSDIHMLGLENPSNLEDIFFINLKSGQPVISIIHNNQIEAFYLIDNESNLHQLIGNQDLLFGMKILNDLTLVNLQKYNLIKYFVSHLFECISIQEAKYYCDVFECLEEKIFYNLLHVEIDYYKIKIAIKKEITKSEINSDIKIRLLAELNKTKLPNKKILNKKIDIDLSGYSIYINSFI